MRISDWSSDVCSSDLKDVESVQAFGTELDPYAPRYEWINHSIHGRHQHLERSRLRIGGEEIGRASCRERVCQYVSISVVAVSLKKKKQQPTSDHKNREDGDHTH